MRCSHSRIALPIVLALLGAAHAGAQAVSYTASQAAAGRAAYAENCAACHAPDLMGEGITPSLRGEVFDLQWAGKRLGELLQHVRRMPMPPVGDPGSLSDQTYTEILAFIFEQNDIPGGDRPLPTDVEALRELLIPAAEPSRPRAGLAADAPTASGILGDLTPATEELLRSPPAEDWPLWNRTYDATGFSPLSEIDRHNVGRLEVAWRVPLEAGESQPSPLVHRGVMYLHTYPDTTLALDASTGAELWRFTYEPSRPSSKKMGVALFGDRIFVPTSDLHVVALDARTGELIWDHDIRTESPKTEQYQLRAAPLVAGGKVMQGVMSFRAPRGSFITAIDLETGEESWRFHTVARPGELGGNTWNDLPLDARNGGSVWVTGSYDPELDLVYFGPAPTYDTAPLMEPVGREGVSNDALFTNTTVAIRPSTGELVWHYQHLANDQWDLDWAFERQIVELEVDGRPRKAVVTVGKSAIVEALDAATGEYLFSIDLGLQNVIDFIDPRTGRKTVRPDSAPSTTETRLICPTAVGARSWLPTSYNPRTQMLYLPLTEGCMIGGPEGFKGLLTSGVGLQMAPHPDSSDGNMGRMQAVNLATRQLAWSWRQPTPLISSTLATAGGVVFVGDLEPSLEAFDQTTGALLWRQKLDDVPGSKIISYAAGGRQYVAVVVGQPNNASRDWARIHRQFRTQRGLEVGEPPDGGAAILAFALER